MCFVILKIKQRQHELTLALVPYPGYFGSEARPSFRIASVGRFFFFFFFFFLTELKDNMFCLTFTEDMFKFLYRII